MISFMSNFRRLRKISLLRKKEKEEALEASETKLKEIEEERETLKKELEDVQAGLAELKTQEEARLAQEKFNERMASFDEEFKLTDEDREVIAKDVADMDDETFAAYGEKMKVLLKDKNKKMLEEKKKGRGRESCRSRSFSGSSCFRVRGRNF